MKKIFAKSLSWLHPTRSSPEELFASFQSANEELISSHHEMSNADLKSKSLMAIEALKAFLNSSEVPFKTLLLDGEYEVVSVMVNDMPAKYRAELDKIIFFKGDSLNVNSIQIGYSPEFLIRRNYRACHINKFNLILSPLSEFRDLIPGAITAHEMVHQVIASLNRRGHIQVLSAYLFSGNDRYLFTHQLREEGLFLLEETVAYLISNYVSALKNRHRNSFSSEDLKTIQAAILEIAEVSELSKHRTGIRDHFDSAEALLSHPSKWTLKVDTSNYKEGQPYPIIIVALGSLHIPLKKEWSYLANEYPVEGSPYFVKRLDIDPLAEAQLFRKQRLIEEVRKSFEDLKAQLFPLFDYFENLRQLFSSSKGTISPKELFKLSELAMSQFMSHTADLDRETNSCRQLLTSTRE